MTLGKRIQRLESRLAARGGPRRHIFLWLNEGDDPEEVRAQALSSRKITEGDRVQFVRWQKNCPASGYRPEPGG